MNINVSEIFHSIQGEGNTSGMPSVFLRLQSCNLCCGGYGTIEDKELHGGATWRCDTIEVWLKGDKWKTKALAHQLVSDYHFHFTSGSQLVITGGEPMLQQDEFVDLVGTVQSCIGRQIRVEVETNGTIQPSPDIANFVDQYNISPKLANSGMPKKTRIRPDALNYLTFLCKANKAIFKFVVTDKSDVVEILEDFVKPFGIPQDKIWLMPGCSTQEEFARFGPLVAEICKKHGFQFSSRLQINLWNETTGV